MAHFEKGKWYLISQQNSKYVNIVLCKEESDGLFRLKGEIYISIKGEGYSTRPFFSKSGGEWSDIQSSGQIDENDSRIQNYLPKEYKSKDSANLIKAKSLYKAGDKILYSEDGGITISEWTLRENEIYTEQSDGSIIYGKHEVHLYNASYKYWMENNVESKEIIGYKLKKDCEQYRKAALLLINEPCFTDNDFGGKVDTQIKKNITIYRKAGVLDLWFEPVYKSKEVVIRMGNAFDLIIKEGKVFHGSEDITKFIRDIHKSYNGSLNHKLTFDKYDFHIKDIMIAKTGCQNVETKLSEWIAVYNELQKQN